jgi:hypothetical protein
MVPSRDEGAPGTPSTALDGYVGAVAPARDRRADLGRGGEAMFVQIFAGPVADRDLFAREAERWGAELRPGAEGWVGGLWGISPDGEAIGIAEFESEEAARANSDRPEQGEWWSAIEPAFESVTFYDCPEVDTMERDGAPRPGFVQIIDGRVKDKAAARTMMTEHEGDLMQARPDIVSGLMAWRGGDGEFCQIMAFTSEDEAHRGEQRMPDDEVGQQYMAMMADEPTFIDLPEPHFF